MTRRSIFKGFVACVAASAMEVCGWRVPKLFGGPRGNFHVGGIESIFVAEANRVMNQINRRQPNPWMEVIKRAEFPNGMGITISKITYEKSV